MLYLFLALFVYVCFALKNNKIIKTTVGNELIIPAERNKQKISWLAVVVLILFAGVRDFYVGSDLPHYYWVFERIGKNHNISNGDQYYGVLYKILNWICSMISVGDLGFSIMLLIISIVVVLSAVYVSKEMSSDISMSMFLFVCIDCYVSSFSMLRQSFAIVFVMIAFKSIYNKRPFVYILSILSAYFFHESAILLLPLYLIRFLNKRSIEYVLYFLGAVCLVLFSFYEEQIVDIICRTFNFHYYSSYGVKGAPLTMMSYLKGIMIIGVFVFFLLFRRYREKKNLKTSKCFDLCLIFYYFSALLNFYNMLTGYFITISRMTYYFTWVLILMVPEFLESIENKKWKKIFTCLMVVAGICYLSTTVVLRDQFLIDPYKTIFGF